MIMRFRPSKHVQTAVWLALLLYGMGAFTFAHADAQIGLRYFEGGQFAEAVQSWRTEAEVGDPNAALYVGVLYDTGLGVAQDYVEALKWYERAASAGSPIAMLNLAIMYDTGRGISSDRTHAAYWYERAAAKGVGRAAYNLGLLYEAGDGVPRDRHRSVQFFRAAAANGISAAREHLARLGERFTATVRPREEATMLDFERAQHILLTRGTAEAAQAIALFRRAAQNGNALAEYDLGYCLEHGIGVAADLPGAIASYRRAATHAPNAEIKAMAEASVRNIQSRASQVER